MRNVFRFLLVVLMFVNVPVLAQQRSAKRGICWDEKNQQFTGAPIAKMAPGVAWVYNWGVAPTGSSTVFTPTTMTFIPMCWNGDFNDTSLRQYLTAHQGEVEYLLAFNEPNLQYSAGGSAMTPQQAANAWSKVEQVAADFGLQIVAPALNFTGDYVGGKIWEPFAWYDEFFRLVPNAKVDYLCFHSYMNYYSAVDWLVNEYFYTDKEENDLMTTANRAKYPNLVAFMDNYKTAHGHYPKMFLTEFCSWETNSYPYSAGITLDFQIDQMVQKLLKLELSDMVEGYAWFMANPTGGAASFPYMSIFKTNTSSSDLSDLGKVYVYMSSFDKEKYYMTGETILAKDFINASMDNEVPRVRPNTETSSDIPLQIEWRSGSWTAYQVNLPSDGEYTLTLHMSSTAANDFRIYDGAFGSANKRLDTTLPSTNGVWQDVTTEVTLTAGQHTLLLYNMGTSSILINQLRFDTTTGIYDVRRQKEDVRANGVYYDLNGRRVTHPTKGIYIVRSAEGRLQGKNGNKVVIK